MTGPEPTPDGPPRVVVDTNILVAAAYKPRSASAGVVAACLEGRLVAVVSPSVVREYRYIFPRAVHGPSREGLLDRFLAVAVLVEPAEAPAVVAADPTDDALFAAALAGGAGSVVTSDGPVLRVGAYRGVRAVRPSACLDELPEAPVG